MREYIIWKPWIIFLVPKVIAEVRVTHVESVPALQGHTSEVTSP